MGGWDAPWHWIVLIALALLLFGYKKLPDASRSLGRSLRIFKTEIKGMTEDDKARAKASDEADTATAPRALPQAEVVRREPAQQAPAEPVRSRPRPSPSPNGRQQATSAKTD